MPPLFEAYPDTQDVFQNFMTKVMKNCLSCHRPYKTQEVCKLIYCKACAFSECGTC